MVRLRSAGFNPVREDIDALGLGYVRLQTPDDKGLAQSIQQARKIAPNAAIGSNPIYFSSGQTTRGRGAIADGVSKGRQRVGEGQRETGREDIGGRRTKN